MVAPLSAVTVVEESRDREETCGSQDDDTVVLGMTLLCKTGTSHELRNEWICGIA